MSGKQKKISNIPLKYYVLNYNSNSKRVEDFNIFSNCYLYEETLLAVQKYVKDPESYSYEDTRTSRTYKGFEAFCQELDRLVMWQMWSRCEYEIAVGNMLDFYISNIEDTEPAKLKESLKNLINSVEKIDCYRQVHSNIELVAHEVIRQYEQYCRKSKVSK